MKKIFFNKWLTIIGIVVATLAIYLYTKLEKDILKPDDEKLITVKGNSQSLDASVEIQIISCTVGGKVKLSYGDNWYNVNTDIHYNIDTSQIEKWKYDSNLGKLNVTVLQNPLDGIEVDKEGIIMSTPQNITFGFNSQKDFSIKIKNLSDKEVKIKVIVIYR